MVLTRCTRAQAHAILYLLSIALLSLIGLAMIYQHLWAGLIGLILLVCLQNLRRPIFVSQFGRVMDKKQRATTLSVESQARTWMVALLAPLSGWVADHYALYWVYLGMALLLCCGLAFYLLRAPSEA